MKNNLSHSIRLSMEGNGDENEEVMELLESESVAPQDNAFEPRTEYDNVVDAESTLESLYQALESHRGTGLEELSPELIAMTIQRTERLSGIRYSGESFNRPGAHGTLLALANVQEYLTTVSSRKQMLEQAK
jgi:hypothetical protein